MEGPNGPRRPPGGGFAPSSSVNTSDTTRTSTTTLARGTTGGDIVFIDPPPLPRFLEGPVPLFGFLTSRTKQEGRQLSAAVHDVLDKMGADPGQIEAFARRDNGKAMEALCRMFCGANAPIKMIVDDGDVVYAIHPNASDDDVQSLVDTLVRNKMPLQAASLLLSSMSRRECKDKVRQERLETLASLLQKYPGTLLPKDCVVPLRDFLRRYESVLKPKTMETLRHHVQRASGTREQRALLRQQAKLERIVSDLAHTLPKDPDRQIDVLDGICAQLMDLQTRALHTGGGELLEWAGMMLEGIRESYEGLENGGTIRAELALQNFDHALADVKAQLPELVASKADNQPLFTIKAEHANRPVDPQKLLALLKASIEVPYSLNPKQFAMYVEHGATLSPNDLTPAVVRGLWLERARANPEETEYAIEAWLATLGSDGAGLSFAEINSFVSTCADTANLEVAAQMLNSIEGALKKQEARYQELELVVNGPALGVSAEEAEKLKQEHATLAAGAGHRQAGSAAIQQVRIQMCASRKLSPKLTLLQIRAVLESPTAGQLGAASDATLVKLLLKLPAHELGSLAPLLSPHFLGEGGPTDGLLRRVFHAVVLDAQGQEAGLMDLLAEIAALGPASNDLIKLDLGGPLISSLILCLGTRLVATADVDRAARERQLIYKETVRPRPTEGPPADPLPLEQFFSDELDEAAQKRLRELDGPARRRREEFKEVAPLPLAQFAGHLETLCMSFGGIIGGNPSYESMTDLFLSLAASEEGLAVIDALIPFLRERTDLDTLVLMTPHQRQAANVLLAACLAAKADATGTILTVQDSLKSNSIATVYYLLCLRRSAERRKDHPAARAFFLEAVKLYMNPVVPGIEDCRAWQLIARNHFNDDQEAAIRAGQMNGLCDAYLWGVGHWGRGQGQLFDPDGGALLALRRLDREYLNELIPEHIPTTVPSRNAAMHLWRM